MIRLTDSHCYKTSRDYDALYDLVKKTSVICLLKDICQDCRAVAASRFYSGACSVSTRGICYLEAKNKEDFIKQCHKYDLEYIVPDKES